MKAIGIVALALLAVILLMGCAEEEEGATATATPTAAAVTTPEATPSPGARPVTTATPTAGLGRLAFVREGNIWVLDVDSGRERQLTTDGQNWWPQWSADGEWIAFQKRVRQGEAETLTEVWTMRADGSDAAKIADSAGFNIDWSPVGVWLAYSSADGALWAADVEGDQRQQVLAPGKQVGRFAWFPDGKRLVLEMGERAQQATPGPGRLRGQGLWLVNADGTGLTELRSVFVPDSADLGTVSPDGRWLTLWEAMTSASLRADGLALRIMPTTGGEPQEIASATLLKPGFVAWSPQGDRLAIVEGGGRQTWVNKQIVVMQPDGSERRVLSDAGRADLFPAWSPDGQRIAFTSGEGNRFENVNENYPQILGTRRIWVVNPDGSEKRQLTGDPAYADQFPQWSADGFQIMFVRQQAEAIGLGEEEPVPAEIWLMKADGSEQHRVTDGLSGVFGYYGFVDWGQMLDWHR